MFGGLKTSPGTSLHDLHALSVNVLSECLVNLGIGGGKSKTEMARGAYMRYYPHALGHWIGMDTHDTPTVTTKTPIKPGCVLTIEPGLYLPIDDLDVPKSLRGIGVRIEDDVGVTPDKGEVEILSRGLPTSRREVEDLVRGLRSVQ
jgi:Xaa-Pro aminopeptidase